MQNLNVRTKVKTGKKIMYIITDRNRNSLHVGMCSDLVKTLQFYQQMPNLFFNNSDQLNRLIYFEELNSEDVAVKRFEAVSCFTRSQKENMIRSVNPDWVDLTLGLNYEFALN
ncbi:MAG: GIY-YIG nuclease family protein [Sphingobacteriaceae bacterium]|nr:MAG: GIY-YIG nuclease family protein [Sphingobacteriaceae bacterium]